MIASTVPPRRRLRAEAVVVMTAAALAGAWPRALVRVPVVTAAPAPHLIPLDGDPVALAVALADGRYADSVGPAPTGPCVELLDELVQHPHWELHVRERASGCTGTWERRQLTIAADGAMTWHDEDLPTRRLALTADELAAVRGLDRLGCVRDEVGDYGERFYELAWGADTAGGAHIAAASPMGRRLDELLDGAIARYAAARLAAVGPVRIELAGRSVERTARWSRRTAVYRLALDDDGALTVRRGRRVLVRARLDARARADLVDAILAGLDPVDDPEVALARGTATIGGHAHPLSLASVEYRAPLRALADAMSEAADPR